MGILVKMTVIHYWIQFNKLGIEKSFGMSVTFLLKH